MVLDQNMEKHPYHAVDRAGFEVRKNGLKKKMKNTSWGKHVPKNILKSDNRNTSQNQKPPQRTNYPIEAFCCIGSALTPRLHAVALYS